MLQDSGDSSSSRLAQHIGSYLDVAWRRAACLVIEVLEDHVEGGVPFGMMALVHNQQGNLVHLQACPRVNVRGGLEHALLPVTCQRAQAEAGGETKGHIARKWYLDESACKSFPHDFIGHDQHIMLLQLSQPVRQGSGVGVHIAIVVPNPEGRLLAQHLCLLQVQQHF